MDRFRNLKNRLSVSVDKLSSNRRGLSPQSSSRRSVVGGNTPAAKIPISASADLLSHGPSSPGVPARRNRAIRSKRPNSMDESDVEDSAVNTTGCTDSSVEAVNPASSATKGESHLDKSSTDRSLSPIHDSLTPPLTTDSGTASLMMEVMKEVQKIEMITDSMKQKNDVDYDSLASEGIKKLEDKLDFIDNTGNSDETETPNKSLLADINNSLEISQSNDNMSASVTSDKLTYKSLTETSLSISSTLQAESLTSGYFSDTPSESSAPSKPKVPQTVFSTLSNIEDKPPPKKESIYSKILKKKEKEKETQETKQKEPIYARIRPKLKLDTSFKPIEPNTAKSTIESSPVIKPEPIYSKVKPRVPGNLDNQSTISTPSSPGVLSSSTRSSFSPLSTNVEPLYSKITPKSSTLPATNQVYSGGPKRDSSTFPRDVPLESPRAKYPIYTQPLPTLPVDTDESRGRNINKDKDIYYGKVTVRAKEISPVRPNVITINSSGQVPTLPISPQSTFVPVRENSFLSSSEATPKYNTVPSPPVSPPNRRARISRTFLSTSSSSDINIRKSQDVTALVPPPKAPKTFKESLSAIIGDKDKSKSNSVSINSIVGSDSFTTLDSDGLDPSGRTLSRLVEELAIELEAVSRRLGKDNAIDDDKSKKEMLAKLLATYDVPRNLRRVPEVDENEAFASEQNIGGSLGASADELRMVDEHVDTFYADIPDYSHDEFVIALDDENDPKYATLAHEMRRRQNQSVDQQRNMVDMSPGKASSRSAQVYVNVVNVLSALKVLVNSNSNRAATVITRMGTIARPYAKKVQTTMHQQQGPVADPTWIQRRIFHLSGHNGFDELRRYIKGGGEFCKELAVILQERSELESAYAKGLHKLSSKLVKASRDCLGSVHQAWTVVGQELDNEADVHRLLSASLAEDVTRPLRQLLDTQHKVRKGVEGMVDKTTRNVHDWRTAEYKAKKQSHSACRENEKIQDLALEARLGRGRTLSDKEAIKMEKQRRKAEELVQRSDVEYYTCSVRAERARLEWESAIYKGTTCFQTLEEERLAALKQLVEKYHNNIKIAAPKLAESAKRLEEPVSQCDVEKDVATIINAKGTGENIPHQLLPDFYSEDINNVMNRDRRLESLEKLSKMFKTDIDREKKGKQGVENLAKALQETPTFGGEDSQQDVNDKLQHMRAMLAYLEASRHKVQCSLAELERRARPSHPIERHVHTTRDKQGMMVSVLKVPAWLTPDSASPDQSPLSDSPVESPNWRDRGTADGTSAQPDSDFDEFSSQGSDRDYQNAVVSCQDDVATTTTTTNSTTNNKKNLTNLQYQTNTCDGPSYGGVHTDVDKASTNEIDDATENAAGDAGEGLGLYSVQKPPPASEAAMGRCKALYDYDANMYDELTIRTGDIIQLHTKQPDGWWVGELDGTVGIFPATYVEEID